MRFDYQAGDLDRAPLGERDQFRVYRTELVRQSDGSEDWHHTYRFPSYGLGVSVGDFGTAPEERGTPVSVYAFIQIPLFPITPTTDFMTLFGAGLTTGWAQAGPDENPRAKRPTTSTTSYLDLGFYIRQRLTRRFDLVGGFSATHHSNGGVRMPNNGLTVLGPRLALQYSFGDRGPRRQRSDLPAFHPHWVSRFDGGFGIKGVGFLPLEDGTFTPRGTLFIGIVKSSFWRRFYRNGQVGAGLELNVEPGRQPGDTLDPEADLSGGATVGAYGGYEQNFGRIGFGVHVGGYLTRTREDERPANYQRVTMVYRFAERWYTDLSLRFFGWGTGDFVEWGLGYRLPRLPFQR